MSELERLTPSLQLQVARLPSQPSPSATFSTPSLDPHLILITISDNTHRRDSRDDEECCGEETSEPPTATFKFTIHLHHCQAPSAHQLQTCNDSSPPLTQSYSGDRRQRQRAGGERREVRREGDKKPREVEGEKYSMFFLTKMEHKLQLPPHLLDLPIGEAMKRQLDLIFLDKVIAKYGLCITIYDIQSIDGGIIIPTDGCPTYTAVFRMVMFRPFVGELLRLMILTGKTPARYHLLDSWHLLLVNNFSHTLIEIDQRSVGGIIGMESNGFGPLRILFRVLKVEYPPIPLEQPEGSKPFAPMVVTGTLNADGLGHPAWWPEDVEP
ncbi:hypothetical protein Dimus_018771 [Dionaea muscipula]